MSDGAEIDRRSAHGLELSFDSYRLVWRGSVDVSYAAFSGPLNESARESDRDVGPTPQGRYWIDPAAIEELEPSDQWGNFRVLLVPVAETKARMRKCFGFVRTRMYIHGGALPGTRGCIKIESEADERQFFARLKNHTNKLPLEVRYTGERKLRYQEPRCPY